MENNKKTKNNNSRITDISKHLEKFDFEETINIKPKKVKSKVNINKKDEKRIRNIKIFTKTESEKDYLKRVEEKVNQIRKDLNSQLVEQNKFGEHFNHEVENYIFFVRLEEAYKRDIQINGLRISDTNGNGIEVNKPNESCQNLLKYEQQGLSIINSLELKAPDAGEDNNSDDLYQ